MVGRLIELTLLFLFFAQMVLATNLSIVQVSPPVGHTISIGKIKAVAPLVGRPSAIELRSSSICLPVNSVAKIRAQVLDQYGLPVANGTVVHFWSGIGDLNKNDVKTKDGFASTSLACSVVGPARVLAVCGIVQASVSLYYCNEGLRNGPEILVDNFRDGYGVGNVFSAKPTIGKGIPLSGSGIFYSFTGLKAAKIDIKFSSMIAPERIESILCLKTKNEKGKVRTLFDLRRSVSSKGVWVIRSLGGARERTHCAVKNDSKNLLLSLSFKKQRIVVQLKDSKGNKLMSSLVKLKDNLPDVDELWIFGNKDLKGPKSVLLHDVSIHGY